MKINKALTALIAGASLGLSGQVLAANEGSQAGNLISNKVVMTYTVGSATGNTTESNEAQFMVDRRIDFTLTASDILGTVNPGDDVSTNPTEIVFTYKITNLTNAVSQQYKVSAANLSGSDKFDATGIKIFTDNDADYSNGTTADITTGGLVTITGDTIESPVVDTVKDIYIHVYGAIPTLQNLPSLPTPADYLGATAEIDLFVEATDNSGSTLDATVENAKADRPILEDFVLVDADNKVSLTGIYTLKTAYLTVVKDVIAKSTNITGFTGPAKFIPGATATYTAVITNEGNDEAKSVVFLDALDSKFDFTSIGASLSVLDDTGAAINEGVLATEYQVTQDGTGGTIELALPNLLDTKKFTISFDIT